MTEEQTTLSRQLVAHERWRWVGGMLTADDFRIGNDGGAWFEADEFTARKYEGHPSIGPDIADHATAAILLVRAIVARETEYSIEYYSGKWDIGMNNSALLESDLGTAAARALLAAWSTRREDVDFQAAADRHRARFGGEG